MDQIINLNSLVKKHKISIKPPTDVANDNSGGIMAMSVGKVEQDLAISCKFVVRKCSMLF